MGSEGKTDTFWHSQAPRACVTTDAGTAGPTQVEVRIAALDIARGLALFGHQLYYVAGSIRPFQLIVSPIWLKHFRFGPLEYGWRWLTYGERPAFRVASP